MKLTNKLRKVFLILLLSLITMGIGSEAEAAEFWDLNQASVFIKQGRSDTCTLASAVMMVRRAAMASGNANWASITENSMRSTAWLEGSGLYYNFTYAGISVKHGTLAGRDHVISLLNQHPEGIVIYNTSKPHAILLTDYTEGIFFCADPANNTIAGRIPIASASITLDSASQYWYVDSPKITLGPANNTVTFDSEVVNEISYNSAKISTWVSSTGTITEMGFYAGTNLSSLGKYVTAKNVGWTRFHMEYEVANYTKLPAGSTIYYQFFVVNGGKEYKTSLNSFRTGDSPVSFDSEAITDISPDSAKISTWASSTGTITELGFYAGTNSSSLGKYVTAKNVGWTRFHMEYEVANYTKLPAGSTIYYQFFVVNGGKEYKTSLNSFITKAHKHEYTSTIKKPATCTEPGIRFYTCKDNDDSYEEKIPATGHQHTELRNVKAATCAQEGYTGDTYCKDCNTKLATGKSIAKKDHTWDAGKITTAATCSGNGIKTYTCIFCGITKTEAIAATGHGATEIRNKKDASVTSEGYTGDIYCTICNQKISLGKTIAKLTPQTATPGKTIKDKSTNGVYKVLKDGVSVEFTKPVYKKVSVRIPDTIKVNGITCKVTGISANAFKNNKSLNSVTIGRNVTVIGTNAFYGCKKLSKVNGGNGIVKIDHRAFANCSSLSKIIIPGSVRSIGKQAFCNCKKLRSITIKTSTLSGKSVGLKAFAGTYKKPTVKVPAKQMKAYKKILKARGMSSKAVYRK